MFRSAFEKQLDSKRRIVLPQEFRAAAASPAPPSPSSEESFDGVFCFPSIEANCLEGGGQALFETYKALIEELPFGDGLRSALELTVYGGMARLAYDTAGRITLPESVCEMFGLTDWVAVVGLGERFQIWNRDEFRAHRERQLAAAREGLPAYRAQQRLARAGGAG